MAQHETKEGQKFLLDQIGDQASLTLITSDWLLGFEFLRIEVRCGAVSHTLQITRGYVDNLPGEVKFQESAAAYFACLGKRAQAPHAFSFLSHLGCPLTIEVGSPSSRVTAEGLSFYPVSLGAVPLGHASAQCTVPITLAALDAIFHDPFLTEKRIVNHIREAVDSGTVEIPQPPVSSGQHQEVPPIDSFAPLVQWEAAESSEIQKFIARKVYWLGFKIGDRRTKVWILDPWDAEYLGVSEKQLRQAAEILQAQGLIEFAPDTGFASSADGLLQSSAIFETPETEKRRIGFGAH